MTRTAVLTFAFIMPAVASAAEAEDYEGTYDLACADAVLTVDVFASQGTLGLAADERIHMDIPLACDGAPTAEQMAFTMEGVIGCTAKLGDVDTCRALVGDVSVAVEDFNEVLDSRIPRAMSTRAFAATNEGPPTLRTRHVWESGVRRVWSYDLDPGNGQFRTDGLAMPALDVTMIESLGFACDTFTSQAEILGTITAATGELASGINAEPAAICVQPSAASDRDDVIEIYAHFQAAVEGQRIQ